MGAETWVLSALIAESFPATGKKSKANRLRDGSWWKAAAKTFLQGSGTQSHRTYLEMRQTTVA